MLWRLHWESTFHKFSNLNNFLAQTLEKKGKNMKRIFVLFMTLLVSLSTLAYSSIDQQQIRSTGIQQMAKLVQPRSASMPYYFYSEDAFFQLTELETVTTFFQKISEEDGSSGAYLTLPTLAQDPKEFNQSYYDILSNDILKLARENGLQVFTAADRGMPYYDYVLVFDPRTRELYLSMTGND
jgi:hypothetical protein